MKSTKNIPIYFQPELLKILGERVDEERKKELLFHIKKQDYFSSIALLTDMFTDAIEHAEKTGSNKEVKETYLDILRQLKEELMFLHKHYKIVPKRRFFK